MVRLEAAAKAVGVGLQRDAIVVAAREKPPDVQLRESWNPKLSVLLDMDEFMEQEPVREGHVRHDHISECDGGHLGEARQAREAHARQHRVERRVLDVEPLQDEARAASSAWGRKKPTIAVLCAAVSGAACGKNSSPLRGDVLGDEAGDLQDLFRREFRHCHDLPIPYFIAPSRMLKKSNFSLA